MRFKLIFLIIIYNQICYSQNVDKTWPLTTMVNDVTFKESTYDKLNIGCGFLLKHNNDTFAISAKHILIVAKTDKMQTTNFENELKQWTMYPRDKKEQTVIIGRLLNENRTDSLSWDYYFNNFFSYTDWLVFDIDENNSDIQPIEISNHSPAIGDTVFAIGWTYEDTLGEQRVYSYKIREKEKHRLKMSLINAPENGGGLSGAPVVNSDGYLVGIISAADFDPDYQEIISYPCNTNYIINYLNNMTKSNY